MVDDRKKVVFSASPLNEAGEWDSQSLASVWTIQP
jgi:hypothetical protein